MYIEACGEEMSRVSHYWNRGTDVRLGTAPLISKGGLTLLSGRFHALPDFPRSEIGAKAGLPKRTAPVSD
jgi:hypothetical protein